MGIGKRHYYVCAGETLSWQDNWYTQEWFTDYRQSYDRAASTGPVDPPLEVIQTVSACSSLLSSEKSRLSEELATRTMVGGVVTTESVVGSVVSEGKVLPTTRTTVFTVFPTTTTGMLSTETSMLVTSMLSSITSIPSSTSVTSSSTISATAQGAGLTSSNTNTCAGNMDWQGWGAIASLGIGVIIGGLIWLLWGLLRGKIPGLFATRTWFVSPEARPSKPWSLIAFLLPFLHVPSLGGTSPISEGHLALHSMLAALKLAAISSLLALAAALPMFMAGVPCLSSTSPSNALGGKLGALTDMSILRLLNSLDPSPGSISTSVQLNLQPYIRALPSTIAPAIDSARTRLIVLLVIIAVLGCGGGLFVIFRTYTTFARYRKHFEQDICSGLEMIVIPASSAVAWKGLSEEAIKRWLDKRKPNDEVDIIGMFGIPDTFELDQKVKERDEVLQKLEKAEMRYIQSFRLVPTASNRQRLESVSEEDFSKDHRGRVQAPQDYVAPKDYYKLSSGRPIAGSHEKLNVPFPKAPTMPNPDTRFREVNRDSILLGRLAIGQRVRIDSTGQFVPDSSPESEGSNPLGTPSADSAISAMPNDPPLFPPTAPSSPRNVPLPPSPEQSQTEMPIVNPGPERQMVFHPPATAAAVVSATPSQDSSPVGKHYSEIRDQRGHFKQLNEEISQHQQKAFGDASKGERVKGWLLIGKGVRYLPGAQTVEGATREDILWDNVGHNTGETIFWIKVGSLALLVMILMVPFIGLTVATAPGFAHYLGFLRPLAESDGFGSGVAQGLAPAIAVTTIIGIAVFAITRFAHQTRVISRTKQRALAYAATFYLTLFTTLLWPVTAAAVEFAVQAFNLDVQKARAVGDGAVFTTWFIFVVMLNIAVIVPGLYLLQPRRLWRYWRKDKTVPTPRQRFRRTLPPSFNPSWAYLPFLIAVFYAFSLVFLFPLLAIPILLLIYLGMVANRYMVEHVLVERVGYSAAAIGLWTIRRFGWVLGIQPALFGLILLSRREWALGGASLGVAVITVILSEVLTARRYRAPRKSRLSSESRAALEKITENIGKEDDGSFTGGSGLRTRVSDSSMLRRVAALLPGYSRLPGDCPLPLPTEDIDDLFYTEQASYARPAFAKDHSERRFFHDPAESIRGLVYPPAMLAPVPVIWLPNDQTGVASSEAADLENYHGLAAIVDPEEPDENSEKVKRWGKQKEKGQSAPGEATSPLLR